MTKPQQDPLRLVLRTILPIALVTLAVLLAGIIALTKHGTTVERPGRAPGLNADALPTGLDRRPAPGFALTDATSGARVRLRELEGSPILVTFLYTHCPDVCILIGLQIRDALKRLGDEASEVTVAAVTVDPRGDTPENVGDWLHRHRLPPNFRYLIGTEKELRPVWRDWFVLPQDQDRLNVSSHTASLWLIDRSGALRGKYSGSVPIDPDDLAADLRTLIDDG